MRRSLGSSSPPIRGTAIRAMPRIAREFIVGSSGLIDSALKPEVPVQRQTSTRRDGSSLVPGSFFHVIDDKNFNRNLSGFQLQSELFLDRRKDGWAIAGLR